MHEVVQELLYISLAISNHMGSNLFVCRRGEHSFLLKKIQNVSGTAPGDQNEIIDRIEARSGSVMTHSSGIDFCYVLDLDCSFLFPTLNTQRTGSNKRWTIPPPPYFCGKLLGKKGWTTLNSRGRLESSYLLFNLILIYHRSLLRFVV